MVTAKLSCDDSPERDEKRGKKGNISGLFFLVQRREKGKARRIRSRKTNLLHFSLRAVRCQGGEKGELLTATTNVPSKNSERGTTCTKPPGELIMKAFKNVERGIRKRKG